MKSANIPAMSLIVTDRALIQRINRKLASELQQMKVTRSNRWRHELGDYYTIDLNNNAVIDKHVDPEELGRTLGCLTANEKLGE